MIRPEASMACCQANSSLNLLRHLDPRFHRILRQGLRLGNRQWGMDRNYFLSVCAGHCDFENNGKCYLIFFFEKLVLIRKSRIMWGPKTI